MAEFTDLITISQMTPGPIAINSATFVGTRIAGMPGALAATAGCVLPSCILVTLLAKIYLKYRNLSLLQASLIPASGCDRHDRSCRCQHPGQRFLGRNYGFPDNYGTSAKYQHPGRRYFHRLPDPVGTALK